MSLTIIDVIENARSNMDGMPFQLTIAKDQLDNAITALANGHDPYDHYSESMLTEEKDDD